MEPLLDFRDPFIDLVDPFLDLLHRCHGSPFPFAQDCMDTLFDNMDALIDF